MLFFSFLLWSFSGAIMGQSEEIQSCYDSLFQTHNVMINGSLHQGRHDPGQGHPFFGEMSWRPGDLGVGRQVIKNQDVRYDLLNDCLLLQHFSLSGSHVINLNEQLVRSFTLDGHSFYLLES